MGEDSIPRKILIVDDDALICDLYGDFFEQNGYEVYTAQKVEDALKMLRSQDFDIVLSDVVMPGRGGFDLYEEVQLFNPTLPFVFMTGYEHEEKVLEKLKEYNRRWIAKPTKLEELLEVIKQEMQ